MSAARFSPSAALSGRRVLLCGGTGFLGKVFTSLLLDRFPEIGHLYLLVRSAGHARRRFREELLPSPAFEPLRRRYGARLDGFLQDRLTVVDGDVGAAGLGIDDEVAVRIAEECDVVVNVAGHVVFQAPLDAALRANVGGPRQALAFARRMRRPALVHVSTCYVAGDQDGERREDDPVPGFHPRRGPGDPPLDAESEIAHCEQAIARVREEAEEPALERQFEKAARGRLAAEGKDASGARERAAVAQERKAWIRRRLVDVGAERAQRWGWPNVYVYTKSLGEQLVAPATDVVRALVRPAIIESALAFPEPGWNEGFTTTAPLIQLAVRGQSLFPVRPDVVLDVVPVDAVAAGLAAVTAQACVEEPALVYQLSTSDVNPLPLDRVAGLVELYRRRRARRPGATAVEKLTGRLQIRTVDPDLFEQAVLPAVKTVAAGAARLLSRVEAARTGLSAWARRSQDALARLEEDLVSAEAHLRTFRPYMADRRYVFRSDNVRALFARFAPSDRDRLHWDPRSIDWAHYWVNVHCPGLERWVFGRLERPERAAVRPPRHRTLVELFDTATRAHASRVALAVRGEHGEERYTYAELRECALRAAARLARRGIRPGDKVALLAGSRPEWGMAYFGVLRCGAACVPLAADTAPEDAVDLLGRSDATVLLLGARQAGQRLEIERRLRERELSVAVLTLDELLAPLEADRSAEEVELPPLPAPADAASILFTSGTTGAPRGVVLSHHNLARQVSQLLSVYDLDHRDGMLSLLPLHHSFELSAGFLVPLSRGARITYLSEISGETIAGALRSGRVTCMVGVPAVWDLLRRRLLAPVRRRSARLALLAEGVIALHRRLRDETPLNLGPLLFAPVHLALGGRIRYLISGGAALSRESIETFRGLGFELLEGYGLTEAAPVLTVNRPGERPEPGVVGPPVPGVELRIDRPDGSGVGEVVARGPAVMAGYYNDPAATAEALDRGWLRTGDLGRLDGEGRLFLAGRIKDVVVGPDGENAHPEELERLYAAPALIRELCVVGIRGSGGSERLACLAVPNLEATGRSTAAERRARIEEHVRRTASTLPAHKRIRVLHVQEGELPRTPTRKVKRGEVAALLSALEDRVPRAPARTGPAHLREVQRVVAAVVGCRPEDLHAGASLADLGLDSLGYAELAAALEAAGHVPPAGEILAGLRSFGELAAVLDGVGVTPAALMASTPDALDHHHEAGEITVPPPLAALGRRGYALAERLLYGGLLKARVRGRIHVPRDGHFLVAANHLSHLDAGLVRTALGRRGNGLYILAAADYFFDTPIKRAFFSSFAGLLPIEREATTADSLRPALEMLERGSSVLVFPEGTRSRTGALQEFRRGVGYLALRARVGVLPVRVETHQALPPGSVAPRSRTVEAHIGPFLDYHALARDTAGLGRAEAERAVARAVRAAVERLGRGAAEREGHVGRKRTRVAAD